MTTLLPKNSPIIELKAKFIPNYHKFPEKPVQEWIEKETESQLTAPRQKELTTEIVSRKELSTHGENINIIRKRIQTTYQNQLNPPISVEESIWRYINSEYPSESQEEKKQVYKQIANTGISSVISQEFQFVRSGQEYQVVASRKLPAEHVDEKTKQTIKKINKSNNIPNAISTIVEFVEARANEGNILSLDDNRVWLQVDLSLPAVWDSEFIFENPPHILFNQSNIRVGVICLDEKSKEHVQQDVIYDQPFSFQFLTFTELKRNFIQGPRFKALVQSYDIVLIESEVYEQFRILKLSENPNLFPIDFSKGREEYERIMNSITFRVIDSKERLRIDFGLQTWDKEQLIDNCKFVIEKLGSYAPWGFNNIRSLNINCGSAPQLCIYKQTLPQSVGKLFNKSKGIIPESLQVVSQFLPSSKNLEELEAVEEPDFDEAEDKEIEDTEVADDVEVTETLKPANSESKPEGLIRNGGSKKRKRNNTPESKSKRKKSNK